MIGTCAWTAGAKAARAGEPSTANPFKPLDYNFVVWLHGWAYATYMKAREDDEL